MTKLITLTVLVMSLAAPAIASDKKDNNDLFEKKGDKERIYKVRIETMWTACMKAAAEDNVIEYSNEKEGVITFNTGQTKATWGFRISASLTKLDDNKTRLKLTVKKLGLQIVRWGAEGRRVKEFFAALDKQLAFRLPLGQQGF